MSKKLGKLDQNASSASKSALKNLFGYATQENLRKQLNRPQLVEVDNTIRIFANILQVIKTHRSSIETALRGVVSESALNGKLNISRVTQSKGEVKVQTMKVSVPSLLSGNWLNSLFRENITNFFCNTANYGNYASANGQDLTLFTGKALNQDLPNGQGLSTIVSDSKVNSDKSSKESAVGNSVIDRYKHASYDIPEHVSKVSELLRQGYFVPMRGAVLINHECVGGIRSGRVLLDGSKVSTIERDSDFFNRYDRCYSKVNGTTAYVVDGNYYLTNSYKNPDGIDWAIILKEKGFKESDLGVINLSTQVILDLPMQNLYDLTVEQMFSPETLGKEDVFGGKNSLVVS